MPSRPPLHELADLLRDNRVVALTGAGCSTASGIPDYRGPATRHRDRTPITFQAFVRDPTARQRYWARSTVGWPRLRAAAPNPVHAALAAMEACGHLLGVITQNVDRLHHTAGSSRVVELHGALADVVCLSCHAVERRDALQVRLESDNPRLHGRDATIAPDGDADLPPELIENFVTPHCLLCGGILKPDVVFFGENVSPPTLESAWDLFFDAEVLLVLGSSLTVFSGFRFVKKAAETRMPVGIVNIGDTRGDPHAWVRIDADLVQTLPALSALL